LLLGGLGDEYVGFHFLAAATVAHAAHGRCVQVVAADGKPAVGAHRRALVGDVHALPADFRAQPDIDPGMTGGIIGVADAPGERALARVAARQ